MKRFLIVLASVAVLAGTAAKAQTSDLKFKPYGFIRNYAFFDSRATKSLSEDAFFFIPLDKVVNPVSGNDLNAVSSYNFLAITTRLGLDVTGYEIAGVKMNGKIEGDFYSMNGAVGVFRMRQAFVKLDWGASNLLIGQAWHPMAADMAHTIALETAAPFTPFSRSAQLQYNYNANDALTLTAALIQQMQYKSAGPDGSSNKYQRHAFPEIYLGLSYKNEGFLGRVGVDILNIRPHYGYEALSGKKYDELLTTVSPFAYIQYTNGDFQLKAKTILAQAGEHMQLNGGYAVSGIKNDGISCEYTPFKSSVSFVSAQYKLSDNWTLLGMLGLHKGLGTSKDIVGPVYFSGNGFANIDSMVRFTPTIQYTLGRFQFALEYDYTTVSYGDLRDNGKVENRHSVANNRILTMVKFNL